MINKTITWLLKLKTKYFIIKFPIIIVKLKNLAFSRILKLISILIMEQLSKECTSDSKYFETNFRFR